MYIYIKRDLLRFSCGTTDSVEKYHVQIYSTTSELRQFQFVTAYKFVHETKERTVSCIPLSTQQI